MHCPLQSSCSSPWYATTSNHGAQNTPAIRPHHNCRRWSCGCYWDAPTCQRGDSWSIRNTILCRSSPAPSCAMPVYADCTFVKYEYCYSPLLEQKSKETSGWCSMMALHFVYAILSLIKLIAQALTIFGILWISIDYFRVLWLRRKLPPGPFPLPLIGNHLDMRMKRPWRHWEKLSFDVYKNPMVTLWNGHRPVICCNDAWTISDMFEKRATIYSSRPRMVMMGDMTNTTNHNQVCLKYDDQWRTHRKLSVS